MDTQSLLNQHPVSLIQAIYEVADDLERADFASTVQPEFRDRMIFSVLQFASRNQLSLDCDLACGLLRQFWTRNAPRIRKVGRTVPLYDEIHTTNEPSFNLGSELQQIARDVLLANAFSEERVAAYLLECLGEKPSDIVDALFASFGVKITSATLRQWRVRHYDKMTAILRQNPQIRDFVQPTVTV